MTFTAPRPLYTRSVAMALVITFFACMALLSAWYLVPYPQPDVALFQWCGTAFMLACALGMPLVFHCHHIVLAMSATFALKLAADLVHRLRRG